MKSFKFGDGSTVELRESVNIYELKTRLARWRKENPAPPVPETVEEVERMGDDNKVVMREVRTPNPYDPEYKRDKRDWERREAEANGALTIGMSIVLNDEQRAEMAIVRLDFDFGESIMSSDEYLFAYIKTNYLQDQDAVRRLNAEIGDADESEVDIDAVLDTFRHRGAMEWAVPASNGRGAATGSKAKSRRQAATTDQDAESSD